MRVVISTAAFLILLCGVCLGGRRDPPPEQTPLLVFTEHTDKIMSAAFSPDSRYIATGARDWTAKVWDAETGEVIHSFHYARLAFSVDFSPDGSILAVAWGTTADEIHLYSMSSGELIRSIYHASPRAVAFAPDGETLVTGGGDGANIKFWDLETGDELDTVIFEDGQYGSYINELAFSPDGTRLLVAYSEIRSTQSLTWDQPEAALISVPDRKVIALYQPPGNQAGFPIDWSPDGALFVMEADYYPRKGAYIYDSETLSPVCIIKVFYRGRAFSPNGRMLAIANVIYDPRSGEEIQTLPYDYDAGAWFLPVEWSPDGSKLLIVSLQTQAEVWDVSDLNTGVTDWRERGE